MSGVYNISVHVDYNSQVSEVASGSVSVRWIPINVQQRLPDFIINIFTVSVESTTKGNRLNYSYTVENVGPGKTIGILWLDKITVSSSSQQKIHRNVVSTEEMSRSEYHYGGTISIPSSLYGRIQVKLVIDADNQVFEENETNNMKTVVNVTLLPTLPDLKIIRSRVVGRLSYANDNGIGVEWVVINDGRLDILNSTWQDSIFINSVRSMDGSTHLLDLDVKIDVLMVQQTYR